MNRRVSQSEFKTYRDCKRKWWLKYYRKLNLKPEHQKPNAAKQGTLVHECLERIEVGEDWRKYLEESKQEHQDRYLESPDDLKESDNQHDLAEIMVSGYLNWLEDSGADEFLETISVEKEVSSTLKPGVDLVGKLDKVVQHTESGQVMFLDYKTVANLSDIPRHAAVDEQFLMYSLILNLASDDKNHVPQKGIWRMIKKSKRTDRTLSERGQEGEFFGEHSYTFNETQLDNFKSRVEAVVYEIENTERQLDVGANHHSVAYPSPSKDCSWKCDFYAVCPMFDDGSRVDQYLDDWYEEHNPMERYIKDNGNS